MNKKFCSLLSNASSISSPAEAQDNARLQFPELVASSTLKLWKPGDPVHAEGVRILVGVAADYSRPDLELLDQLHDAKLQKRRGIFHIDVFNVSECRKMDDFEHYIPGIGKVYQTPVVGIWEMGHITQRSSGAEARVLLSRFAIV